MGQLASRMGSFTTVRRDSPLSDDLIHSVAPSIFAGAAHHTRSERYAYIPTIDVLNGLRKEGFQPFSVSQSRTRLADRREHTRHLIRLRHVGDIAQHDSLLRTGEAAHEIVLLNSHDGTSSYQMLSGMFRFVCANGMVCGDIENDIRIRHKGNSAMADVIEGAYKVLNHQTIVADTVEHFRTIQLGTAEQAIFADEAIGLRFDGDKAPITSEQALQAHRFEDRDNSLWSVLNRTQENLIRGGMEGRSTTGKIRRVRAVTGMDQDTKLNRALWSLAQRMAELKAA